MIQTEKFFRIDFEFSKYFPSFSIFSRLCSHDKEEEFMAATSVFGTDRQRHPSAASSLYSSQASIASDQSRTIQGSSEYQPSIHFLNFHHGRAVVNYRASLRGDGLGYAIRDKYNVTSIYRPSI